MNKFTLLIGHGFVSYVFSIILGLVFLFTGIGGLVTLTVGSAWLKLSFLFLSIFLATFCSAWMFSKNFSFTKNDTRFVIFSSLIIGLLLIYSGSSGEFEDTKLQTVINNMFVLIGYLVSTFLFLKSKKNIQ